MDFAHRVQYTVPASERVIPKAFAALLFVASPALAQNAQLSEGPITCSSPVSPNESAKSLMLRYGDEAIIQDDLFTGIEDITYKGLVLHPRPLDWRIEVAFTDETMSRVSVLTLPNDAKSSHWNFAGVTVGASLADVQKINGTPFLVKEAETDADGFVASWNGGILDRPLPGNCMITVRFGRNDNNLAPISGDRVSSDNPKLVKWPPVVILIEVNFPKK
jgi:hypothetical protein